MSWGLGLWGIDPWGSVVASIPAVSILAKVDVIARDQIVLEFNAPMRNEPALLDVANYAITPVGAGQSVNVISVLSGNRVNPTQIQLIITNFSIGEKYLITVSSGIHVVDGTSLDASGRTGHFVGRRTKIDSLISSRPQMYDVRPTSVLRTILTAIGRQDDLLGGSRKDYLP
jgi:hypothetical protein